MDHTTEKHALNRTQWLRVSNGLRRVRGFFSRLVGLFRVTQQDLKDAGIYRR